MEILTKYMLENAIWEPSSRSLKRGALMLPEGPVVYYEEMRITLVNLQVPPVEEWGKFVTLIENDIEEIAERAWFQDLYNMMAVL